MANAEKVIKIFEKYINDFVPCCSTDDYDLDLFRTVLELLKEQKNNVQIAHEEGFHDGYGQALAELNAKQFEKVVRCKDCKYGYPMIDSEYVTCLRRFHDGQKHEANWFCADGEQKEVSE